MNFLWDASQYSPEKEIFQNMHRGRTPIVPDDKTMDESSVVSAHRLSSLFKTRPSPSTRGLWQLVIGYWLLAIGN